jgi:hypothetical protein
MDLRGPSYSRCIDGSMNNLLPINVRDYKNQRLNVALKYNSRHL